MRSRRRGCPGPVHFVHLLCEAVFAKQKLDEGLKSATEATQVDSCPGKKNRSQQGFYAFGGVGYIQNLTQEIHKQLCINNLILILEFIYPISIGLWYRIERIKLPF